MNFNLNDGSGASMAMVLLTSIVAIVTTVFWMIVGWRAMRAHERMADTLNEKLK